MSCSVIIVTYQTGPALWQAVNSALAQADELIVVDNGNPPDVTKYFETLAAKDPKVRHIVGQGNVGFAKGCNLGVKAATQSYVLLLNPDCRLPEGALKQMEDALLTHNATLGGCFLMNPDGTEQRGSRRNLLTPETGIRESSGAKAAVHLHETAIPEDVTPVPAISGAFMFMERQRYASVGGMDEGYFLHMEDMDLCYRINEERGKIIWVPQVKVMHFRSTSLISPAKLEWHKAKGFARYFCKHFRRPMLPLWLLGIWGRFIFKWIGALLSIFRQEPQRRRREAARLIWLSTTAGQKPVGRLPGKTVLVTGAASQVGICTIGELLNSGAMVYALTRTARIPYAHARLNWIQGDLGDPEWSLGDIKPDVVVHAADLWLLPAALPKLLEAGVKRVVAFSSMSAETKKDSRSSFEREVAGKLAEAEKTIFELCKGKGSDCTIFRSTMIYGVGLDENITRLATIIRKMHFLPVYKKASGLRQPVQAGDLGKAVVQCIPLSDTYAKIYEMGGLASIPYREMLEQIFRVLGRKPRLVSIPMLPKILTGIGFLYQLRQIHGEIALRMNRDMVCDISAAQQDFAYLPQPFKLNSDMF